MPPEITLPGRNIASSGTGTVARMPDISRVPSFFNRRVKVTASPTNVVDVLAANRIESL
ncbi:hypothetical protein D3C75_1083210 [compost metagenome]